jgi:hypothetical protein
VNSDVLVDPILGPGEMLDLFLTEGERDISLLEVVLVVLEIVKILL